MHPEKLKVYISKLLFFSTLTSFSNFLHVPREAQSIHLKAFALQYFDILLRIFSMHSEKLKVYISKLLLFTTLISFLEFSPCTTRSLKYTSQNICSSTLRYPFRIFSIFHEKLKVPFSKLLLFTTLKSFLNFLHASREAQSAHLKAFALHHFDILFKFYPCSPRSSKNVSQSFCSSPL